MKQILTFAFGGLLVGGVVWYGMKEKAAAPETGGATVEIEAPAAAEPAASVSAERVKPSPVPTRVAPVPEKTRSIPAPTSAQQPVEQPNPVARVEPTPAPVEHTAPAPVVKADPPPPPPAPRVAKTVTLTEGTQISIRLAERLSSDVNMSGDEFSATLDKPVVVDGFVIAERGAKVMGKISEVDKAGRLKGVSRLALELSSFVTADGQTIAVRTSPMEKLGEKDLKNDAKKVGIGAAVGATIGAIAGGGKGAAIGAAAGAGAGTGAAVATKGPAVEFPVETRLTFALTRATNVTEKLK